MNRFCADGTLLACDAIPTKVFRKRVQNKTPMGYNSGQSKLSFYL